VFEVMTPFRPPYGLRARGVSLSVTATVGGSMRRADLLTPDDRRALAGHKDDLLAVLISTSTSPRWCSGSGKRAPSTDFPRTLSCWPVDPDVSAGRFYAALEATSPAVRADRERGRRPG